MTSLIFAAGRHRGSPDARGQRGALIGRRARLDDVCAVWLSRRVTPLHPAKDCDVRFSVLTHAADDVVTTFTLVILERHTSVASLARDTRVSPKALAR